MQFKICQSLRFTSNPGGGGTHYVRVMGRFRGIQPPFSRHWEKYRYLTPLYYQGAGENIDFRPLFHTFKGKCQL